MKPGALLEVANVGDSGVRLLRNGKIIFGTDVRALRGATRRASEAGGGGGARMGRQGGALEPQRGAVEV